MSGSKPPPTTELALQQALRAFSPRSLELAIMRLVYTRIYWLDSRTKREILTQLTSHGQAVIPSPRIPTVPGFVYDPLRIVLRMLLEDRQAASAEKPVSR